MKTSKLLEMKHPIIIHCEGTSWDHPSLDIRQVGNQTSIPMPHGATLSFKAFHVRVTSALIAVTAGWNRRVQ